MVKKRKPDSTGLDEVDRTMYTTFCSAANSLSQLYTQAQHQQKLAFQAGERHGMDLMTRTTIGLGEQRDGLYYLVALASEKPKPQTSFAAATFCRLPSYEEILHQWILRQQEEESRVTVADIVAYLQNELEYGGEDASVSPRSQLQHQNSQHQIHFLNSVTQISSGFAQATTLQGPRSGHSDQNKNSIFSNALSSPVRSLQPSHLTQGGSCLSNILPTGNGGHKSGYIMDSDHHNGFNGLNGSSQNHELNSDDLANQVYPHQSHHDRDTNSLSPNDLSMDVHEESLNHESY